MTALRRVIANGTIGEVLHVEAHFSNEHSTRVVPGGWRDDPGESPGGGLTGAGLHLIDALISLGGPIAQVDAKLFERKPPPDPRDVIALQATFANGGIGQLASVRAAPAYWRVHVFGTKGSAEARDETMLTVSLIGQTPRTETFPQVDSLAALLESFAEAIELGTPFLVPVSEMLAVVGTFEAAIKSLRTGKPVDVAH
jgi:predicted dehydrogenase